MTTVRIATRGSDLAMWQARYVAGRIERELGRDTELVVLRTTGDRIQNVSLAKIGGKGLFIKEIEEALLDGRADVAVHSAKDLPAVLAPELVLTSFPERADPRDALVSRDGRSGLKALPHGARVGTGSTRRTAQLRAFRPDLEIVPLRGNVPTRLGKLEDEGLDAVILACSGLDRLGLADRITERIGEDVMLPAVCQGVLALQARADDPLADELMRLGAPGEAERVAAERGFLTRLEGDCTVPLAAYARPSQDGATISLEVLLCSADGSDRVHAREEAPVAMAADLGRRLAEDVLERGGRAILDTLRADALRDDDAAGDETS
jgi:hydroxymethylbilane synthase